MDHVFWRGYLKLSLVTCPVAMAPATSENEKVRFRTLNRKTGHPVVSRYVDAETGKPVAEDNAVKGYARGEGDYVVLEDDEIAAVALESARTIDVETFVAADSLDWIWYDKPHYLTPDGSVGEEAFRVIRDAMKAADCVGISRLVLYRRERAVMLAPRDRGMILWTLRYGDEVRALDDLHIPSNKSIDAELETLVGKLIASRRRSWSPDMVDDPVQDRLLGDIAAKEKGRKRATKRKPEPAPVTGNVISIVDALRKSLLSEKAAGKRR